MIRKVPMLLLVGVLWGPADAGAQWQPPAPAQRPVAQQRSDSSEVPVAPQPPSADYRVGPGDVLSIKVSGLREFEHSIRISNSGRIRVPYVGVIVAAGMTPADLEQEITRLISSHELVNEPTVRIYIERYRAQPAYVIGEVNTPGQHVMSGDMRVLELLSKAGGLRITAGDVAFLHRRIWPTPSVSARLVPAPDTTAPATDAAASTPATTGPALAPPALAAPGTQALATGGAVNDSVIEIDLDGLRSGRKPEMNVQLAGGDILYVPRSRSRDIYIVGDVKNPGAYSLPRRGDVTAAQAVAYAGGTMRTAKVSHGFLMRHNERGEREAIPVDFHGIIKGKRPDLVVRANDIIFIPTSVMKTIGVGMLDMIPGLVIQYLIF